jgi:hypothetical protein
VLDAPDQKSLRGMIAVQIGKPQQKNLFRITFLPLVRCVMLTSHLMQGS